jgi:RND family efflux transporter MFP subunit
MSNASATRPPVRRSRRNALFAALVTLAVLAVAVLGMRGARAEPPPPPQPPQVTVAAAIGREINDWDEFTGHLEAVDVVEVRPRVSGYVERVAFDEGSEVHKGDVLFVIDQRPYAADVARAKAQAEQARTKLDLARSEAERAKRLLAVQAISREEYDTRVSASAQGDAELRAAEAALRTARLNLEWTTIRSPITGRVGRAQVTRGNLVQAGAPSPAPLTTVVSLDPIYMYFDGDEQTYLDRVGLAPRSGVRGADAPPVALKTVRMGLANEEGFPHEGTIDFVDNHLDPVAGTIRARAVFANHDHRLTPGLFARIKLVGSRKYDATLVRDAAVGTDQDRKFVFVLESDGTVDYRAITLGPLVDGLRVVKDGLKPGEMVVVNGLQRVRPGVKVTATKAPMLPPDSALQDTTASN